MPRRLPVALLLIWQLLAPSGIVWANIAPPYFVEVSFGGTPSATTAVELHPGQTFTEEGEASRIDARTLSMTAGNDLSLKGAEVTAESAILQAGHDLTIGSQPIDTERNLQAVDYLPPVALPVIRQEVRSEHPPVGLPNCLSGCHEAFGIAHIDNGIEVNTIRCLWSIVAGTAVSSRRAFFLFVKLGFSVQYQKGKHESIVWCTTCRRSRTDRLRWIRRGRQFVWIDRNNWYGRDQYWKRVGKLCAWRGTALHDCQE